MALDLPAGGEIQLVGQVVWTRRKLTLQAAGPVEAPGYGIEFVAQSRAEQAAIQRLLDAAAPASQPSAATTAVSTAPIGPTTTTEASPASPASATRVSFTPAP